ncbi:MAG: hypothetical protein LBQ81_12750 [Zoogloeaceae bacterium]|jgi:hypothetical protein|nr:hypothetical protein [Zoogloeaceae bacterium]
MTTTPLPTQGGILPDKLHVSQLEGAAMLPSPLRGASHRFAAWRVLCSCDFSERLRPRSISELAMRAGVNTGRVALLLDLLGWTMHARRRASDRQMWVPPLHEEFTPRFELPHTIGRGHVVLPLDALPRGGEEIFEAIRGEMARRTGGNK